MSKFARIRFQGRTFKIRILSENKSFLYFRKVNDEGDETEERKGKDGVWTITEHLVAQELITCRVPLYCSMKYGTLETEPDR